MSDLQSLGPFSLGVDNRKADHALTQRVGNGSIDLLRSATNVDITAEGRVRRRAGRTAVLAGSNVHSLWSDDRTAFFADGPSLFTLDAAMAPHALRNDLIAGQPLSFCEAGGTYYYTGAGLLGMVRDGARTDFTPTLAATPSLEPTAGALPPGRYQMCFTQTGPAGESAATLPQTIVLDAPGGISIAAPVSSYTTLVYMTGPDGEVLGRVGPIHGTLDIVAPPALGARCPTLLMAPMPSGSIVRFSNGRLLVAVGNLLCYSEPFAHGLFNPAKNFIAFPAPVTLVEPCTNGVFIAADRTYWIDGEITQATLQPKLPYGAVPHSSARHMRRPEVAYWIGEKGLVVGTPDGAVQVMQEAQLALSGGPAGAALVRESEGMQHVITAVRDPMATTGACSSYFDAEIIRKGTTP